MELRQLIETAISKLEEIIDSDAEEAQFQEWFSQNPVVFDVLGYKNQIEHPELLYEGSKFVPDFMAQKVTDEWEIIELKTADASILKNTDRRHAFFAETEKNLSQCREYSLIFYDTACREKFNADYKTVCHKTPSVKLIIGRNNGLNKLMVNELLAGRIPQITIITYDDVINHLKARYDNLRGVVDKPNGIYIAFVATPIKTDSPNDMYIADICQRGTKSRVRLFTSGSSLIMQTDDATGLTVSRIRNYFTNLYATNIYEVEVSPLKYETKISLSISGQIIFETTARNTDFDFSGKRDIVVGSDQNGTAHASIMIGGFTIIPAIPEIEEKNTLRAYLESQVDDEGKRWMLEYIGHKFMHNQGHQILGSKMACSTNLIQELEEHKPILRLL